MSRNSKKTRKLQTRIMIMLLPALLPMLIIVGVTYRSARDSSLDGSKNLSRLIAQNEADRLNVQLALQGAKFQDWVREDVYGLAIEFDTTNELGSKFMEMLAAAPAFSVMVLTDQDGKVLQATNASTVVDGLLGTLAPEAHNAGSATGYSAWWCESELLAAAGIPFSQTIVFGYPCKGSSGDQNGSLLAYLDWSAIQSQVGEVNATLVHNGFPDGQTVLLERTTSVAVAHSDPERQHSTLDLDESTRQWFSQTENAGRVDPFQIGGAIQYVSFAQVLDAERLAPSDQQEDTEATEATEPDSTLALAVFVPESNILAEVKKTLYLSTAMTGAGAALLLGLVWFAGRRIAKPINRIIEGLSEGAERVNEAAEQVSGASQQLSDGASNQASSLEETSSALEQMAAMTRTNAENSKQASTLSDQAKTAAHDGTATMKQLNTAMGQINQSSAEISKIIKVIEGIAFQTNLLALNAAVEAARAGEHGKGFAVVADEVRNLAQRAAQASREITGLIEESVGKARQGTDVANEVGKALDAIMGDVTSVTDLVQGISTASEEQAQGVEQVNTSVSQIDRITQQNAAGAEESAAAAAELAAQAESVTGMVEELSALVGSGSGQSQTDPADA
ncbi:MAG: hypothetical protein GY842_04720 [bacterium]|nr:hypothetical protein [bacterium]